jgi:hypothetical protein
MDILPMVKKNTKITKEQQTKMRKAADRELAMNGPRIKGGAHKTSKRDQDEKLKRADIKRFDREMYAILWGEGV